MDFDSFNVSVIQSWGFVDLLDVSVIQSWGFVDLFDVLMIWSWGFLDSFDVPMIQYLGFVDSFDVLMIRYLGLVDLLKVRTNAHDDWTNWGISPEDPIFRVLCPTICTFWLYPLEDPLFRVLSGSLSNVVYTIHHLILPDRFIIRQSSQDSPPNSYLRLFLVDLVGQYITQWSNITVHYARSVVAIN